MTIFENNEIKLEKFISGSLGNNSYLISSKKDSNSIVIDVPDKPMELINKIPRNRLNKSENLEKIKILITHGHYDHIEGLDIFGEIITASFRFCVTSQDPEKKTSDALFLQNRGCSIRHHLTSQDDVFIMAVF